MDLNGMANYAGLATAFIGLLIFGIFFNRIVEHFQKRTHGRYTAEMVVIGVLVTVTASGFFIGWQDVVILLILFIASGSPMIFGSWQRAAHDDEEAKKIQRDAIKK